MRFAVTVAVLLAVVSTALVAVCQHSESRRLQHRVWQLERRRIRLERQAERLQAAVEAGRAPRRLLVEYDMNLRGATASETANAPTPETEPTPAPEPTTPEARGDIVLPSGFVTGGNFEGGGR